VTSAKAGKSQFFHQFDKVVEEVLRIVGAGGCFGMVLHAEGFDCPAAESFVRVVVEVQMRQLDVFAG